MNPIELHPGTNRPRQWALVEVILIFLVFFLFAGWPPPDVNEAHYLAKAKHYWNPSWCAGDHFLESADAHLVFYWTFGWLTYVFPLPTVAWIGRFLTWGLLAWSWRRLSFAVVPRPLVALLSATLFLFFLQRFHMAGEWVVGGVEAKGFAFVLVFLALGCLVRQRWRTAWVLLGMATSFHVLVGGWSLVATGFAWLSCRHLRPPLRSMLPAMAAGAVLALPGLIPALALNAGVPPDVARDANMIYVYDRLPHHLVFHRFPHLYMARHALLLILWLAVSFAVPCRLQEGELRLRPLRGFVGGAVALAVAGITIDQSLLYHLDIAASLLRFYWYRLADAMLPVGAAVGIIDLIEAWRIQRPSASQWLTVAAILVAGTNLAATNLARRPDMRSGADLQMLPTWPGDLRRTARVAEDWRQACQWIRERTPVDACFLTPYNQQTFKWYAQRSEVCSWKDVPQDAATLIDWWQRQQDVFPRRVIRSGLVMHGERRLIELAEKYDADYIVLDRHRSHRPLLFPRVYPPGFSDAQAAYEVYRIPRQNPDAFSGNEP